MIRAMRSFVRVSGGNVANIKRQPLAKAVDAKGLNLVDLGLDRGGISAPLRHYRAAFASVDAGASAWALDPGLAPGIR